MRTILEASGLTFGWSERQPPLFDRLSLTLTEGHLYGLLGRNGAGKTTLIKLLTGCLRPAAGTVRIAAGEDAAAVDATERRPEGLAAVAFVTESSDLPPLAPPAFGRLAGALYPGYDHARFLANLDALEVPTKTKATRLSFGQRRKAHVAFALATGARLVFLDEPTNGLDVVAQLNLRKLLIGHVAEGRSLVVSTHHVREFETVMDEVLVLEHGRVLAQASLEDLRTQAAFDSLESWYAKEVSHARV